MAAETVRTVEIESTGPPWWSYLVAGIAWLVYAFIVLSFDIATIWAIALFAGFLFVASALSEFVIAAVAPGWKWLHVLLGLVFVGGAVFCFAWPESTFVVLAAIIAWVLLFQGIFNIVVAISNRDVELWWMWLVVGIAEILIAFWAIGYEGRSIALLVIWVGASALAKGITDLMLAYEVKALQDRVSR